MSRHLIEDWVPGLPPLGGQTLVGWPPVLTEAVGQFLALKEEAGFAERQWKGFLSWMTGVCGTRQVLAAEGYDWIAPVSAFYPEARQPVGYAAPPTGFHAAFLDVHPGAPPTSRLRPDYIAVKGGTNAQPWALALVESKGTSASLESVHACPPTWAAQARNAEVRFEGIPLRVDRHLVVATRCNPNAKRAPTRRFQIRAWNSQEETQGVPEEAVVEVVSAALFGVCNNMGLYDTARALSLANRVRVVRTKQQRGTREMLQRALDDLRGRAAEERQRRRVVFPTLEGRFVVRLSQEAETLIGALQEGSDAFPSVWLRDLTRRRHSAEGSQASPLVTLERE